MNSILTTLATYSANLAELPGPMFSAVNCESAFISFLEAMHFLLTGFKGADLGSLPESNADAGFPRIFPTVEGIQDD